MPKRRAASGILRLIEGGKNENTEVEREGVISLTKWKEEKKKQREGEVTKAA